jgi:hypothetical protein
VSVEMDSQRTVFGYGGALHEAYLGFMGAGERGPQLAEQGRPFGAVSWEVPRLY